MRPHRIVMIAAPLGRTPWWVRANEVLERVNWPAVCWVIIIIGLLPVLAAVGNWWAGR